MKEASRVSPLATYKKPIGMKQLQMESVFAAQKKLQLIVTTIH